MPSSAALKCCLARPPKGGTPNFPVPSTASRRSCRTTILTTDPLRTLDAFSPTAVSAVARVPNNRFGQNRSHLPRQMRRESRHRAARKFIRSRGAGSHPWPRSPTIGCAAMTTILSPIALENRYAAPNYHPLPVTLTRGEGAFLWDTSGRCYIDMMGAYSAVSHGHCHPGIIAALTAQANRLAVPSRAYYSDNLGSFLKELCEVTVLEAALPMNPGAGAVEPAIKAARRYGYWVKG